MRVSRDWFAVFAKLFVVPLLVPVPPFSVPYLYTGINSPVDDTMIYPNTDSVNIYLIYSIKKLLCYYGILYAIICEIMNLLCSPWWIVKCIFCCGSGSCSSKKCPSKIVSMKICCDSLRKRAYSLLRRSSRFRKKLRRLRRGFWSFKPFSADFGSTKNFKFCFGK